MKWLEKLGLVKKKVRPVGQKLEKNRDDTGPSKKWEGAVKAVIFLVLLGLTLFAFPEGGRYNYTVQTGDEWRKETLAAPFDFAIYKNNDSLTAEKQAVRNETPPYFREIPEARERTAVNRDTVAQQFDRLFEAYRSYRFNKQRGSRAAAREDSLQLAEGRRSTRVKLTPDQWQQLIASYDARIPGDSSASRTLPSGPRLDEELLQAAWQLSRQFVNRGLLNVPLDTVRTEEIIVRNERESTERAQSTTSLLGLNEVYSQARSTFEERFEDPQHVHMASAFFRAIFQPTLQYLRGETLQHWQQKIDRISPTRGKVNEGDVIVRQDEQVTPEIKRQLASLETAREERGGVTLLWKRKAGQVMLLLAAYAFFFLYLFLLRPTTFKDNSQLFLIALLFGGVVGLFALALSLPIQAMYAVPVAVASLLMTVIFDSRVGLFGTLTMALIGGLLLGFDFEYTFATFFAGVLGIFSVRDIKNRGQVLLSAVPVFVGYLTILTAAWLFFDTSPDRYFGNLLLVGINAFLLIMVYPLLWVFERTFDVTTDLTLLELSDTNRPLLKDLSLRAPGTFNHSLQVANLAEAAADAIGANALQVRVGALYHDIGKMLKPEYFVENQREGNNPHDQLKPRMSALIIASHVKEGLEMGRQYNLPHRVLNFIPTHHGTSRIEYFYQKALEQKDEADPDVLESEFRYPGPRPFSKETGILMLSDSVEAASRSLDDPTHKRLKNLIDMLFEARISDGQLDRTELTFQDLDQIKETFLSLLIGIYHVRVKYPDQEKEEAEREAAESEQQAPPEVAHPQQPESEQRATTEAEEKSSEADAENESSGSEKPLSLKAIDVVGIPEQSVPAPGVRTKREATTVQHPTIRPPTKDDLTLEGNGAEEGAHSDDPAGDGKPTGEASSNGQNASPEQPDDDENR